MSYFGARFYDPRIGRFITKDLFHSTNRYLYCDNDPVNYIDALGYLKRKGGFGINKIVWNAVKNEISKGLEKQYGDKFTKEERERISEMVTDEMTDAELEKLKKDIKAGDEKAQEKTMEEIGERIEEKATDPKDKDLIDKVKEARKPKK